MTSDISHLLPPFCCLSLCSSQTLRCKDKQFVSLSGEGSYRCFVDRNKHGWSICCLSLLVQASYSSSLSTPPPILSSNHSSREQWQSAAFTHSFTSPVIVRKHSTNTLAELSKLQIYLRCCSTHTHTQQQDAPADFTRMEMNVLPPCSCGPMRNPRAAGPSDAFYTGAKWWLMGLNFQLVVELFETTI